MPDDRPAGEVKIADRVKQFVPDELVGIAQPAMVQNPAAADDDDIIERPAAPKAGRLQPRQIVEQPEGARRGELGIAGRFLPFPRY